MKKSLLKGLRWNRRKFGVLSLEAMALLLVISVCSSDVAVANAIAENASLRFEMKPGNPKEARVDINISGIVTSASGESMPGVNVIEKGSRPEE